MIILAPKRKFEVPIQAACITPETFKGKTPAEIAELPVTEGNQPLKLGDIFEIIQDNTPTPDITINGDASKVKRIGQSMASGEIVINGDVGMHTGEKMCGGKITVNGNAGNWTGSEMKGGTIEIHGDAGDYMAAAYRGSSAGMKGGLITVDGKVGSDVGTHLHGGVIKIRGGAGRFLGYHMSNGAILVDAQSDMRPGACMTGGKIVITGKIDEVLPSFTIDSVKPKVKIDDTTNVAGPFYVFLGDLAEHGTGKIFVSKIANPQMKFYEKYL
jgi:formylmethanofuran dehydrogenase subunit C